MTFLNLRACYFGIGQTDCVKTVAIVPIARNIAPCDQVAEHRSPIPSFFLLQLTKFKSYKMSGFDPIQTDISFFGLTGFVSWSGRTWLLNLENRGLQLLAVGTGYG